MTDQSLSAPVAKRADQLVIGDRILNKYLPSPFSPDPGEVVFVQVHEYRTARWVFVAYRLPNGFYDSTAYLPDGVVQVVPADDGFGYSRADDDEVTQPIAGRLPAHLEDGRTGEVFEVQSGAEPASEARPYATFAEQRQAYEQAEDDGCPRCGHRSWRDSHGPKGCQTVGASLVPCGCHYAEAG